MGTVRKFIVEVVAARDLMPKDGSGSSSPYVQVDFYLQRKKTKTVNRNLNPVWNETLSFIVGSPSDILVDGLELYVYHDNEVIKIHRSTFLGRICLRSTEFVQKGEEFLKYYELKNTLKRMLLLKPVKGEIGLKIYYVDEEVPPLTPPPQEPAPPPPLQTEEVKPDGVKTPRQESETKPTAVPEIVEEPPAPRAEPPREVDKTKEEPPAKKNAESPAPPKAEKLPVPKPELPNPPARPQPPTEESTDQVNPAPPATSNILRKILHCQNFVARIL